MAKAKTEHSRFPSHKGGGMVTAAQHLTELLCINMATQAGHDLPDRFWTLPQWKRTFAVQVQHANALLKLYDYRAIAKTLNDKRAKTTRSFKAPWLVEILDEYQKEITRAKEQGFTETHKLNTESKPRPPVNTGKSLRSKLRDL